MTNISTTRKAAPISAHRYFPAIVALWFAALFGLGSLVLPAALPERIVTSLGLDVLLPVLAPPHGFTARILIALAATIIGCAAGLFLSRKIALMQAHRPARSRVPGTKQASAPNLRPSDQHPDAPARRPISALEELGEDRPADAAQDQISQAEGTGRSAPAIAGRRRALMVTSEDGPSDWSQPAPVPGVPEFPPAEGHASAETGEFDASDTLHLPNVPHLDDLAENEPVHSAPLELDNEAGTEADIEADIEAVDIAANIEPDPAMQPMQAARFDAPPAPAPFAQPISFDAPVLATAELSAPDDLSVADSTQPAAPVAQRPLAELGMAELVERLAYAMQHCETPIAEAARTAAPEIEAHDPLPMAEPVEPVQDRAEAAPEPEIPVIPAALRPIELTIGADDNDNEMPGFALAQGAIAPITVDASLVKMTQNDGFYPETNIGEIQSDAVAPVFGPDAVMPVSGNDEDETEGQTETDEASDYSSLLNLKTDLSEPAEFVRIDEPAPEAGSLEPVVVFPGQEMRRAAEFKAPEALDATEAGIVQEDAGPDAETSMAEVPVLPSGPFAAAPVSRPFDSPQTEAVRPDFGKPTEGAEADPAETERALRAALATLQRMSGAA